MDNLDALEDDFPASHENSLSTAAIKAESRTTISNEAQIKPTSKTIPEETEDDTHLASSGVNSEFKLVD